MSSSSMHACLPRKYHLSSIWPPLTTDTCQSKIIKEHIHASASMKVPTLLPVPAKLLLPRHLDSESHPALPERATVQREILRRSLKVYLRARPEQNAALLTNVVTAAQDYLPYIATIDSALRGQVETVQLRLHGTIALGWRSSLGTPLHRSRSRVTTFDAELPFLLSLIAGGHAAVAFSALAQVSDPQQRTVMIQMAMQKLLHSSSIHAYLTTRCLGTALGAPELLSQTHSALGALCLAEATLLAVLKDDPYVFVVRQLHDENDKEWMVKPPDIPKVRAHLFARLCLGAAEHAARAEAAFKAIAHIDEDWLLYARHLRRKARAKACRFLGIDADLGGQTGIAIAWLAAAKSELGVAESMDHKWRKSRQKEWDSEEMLVIDHLQNKWNKMNDAINTQPIPPFASLLVQMPSGRDIHSLQPYQPPSLSSADLTSMQGPAIGRSLTESSSDSEDLPGAFPKHHY